MYFFDRKFNIVDVIGMRTAHTRAANAIKYPRGLSLQDSVNLPSHRAPIDRVVPHAGQGMPVSNLIGQSIGPELNPSNNFAATDIDRNVRLSKTNLVKRLNDGIIICAIFETVENQFQIPIVFQ